MSESLLLSLRLQLNLLLTIMYSRQISGPARCLLMFCAREKCPHAHCSAHVRPVLCRHRFDPTHDWNTCGFAHSVYVPAPAVASAPAPAVASAPRKGTYADILKPTASTHIPKEPVVASAPAPVAAPVVASVVAPVAASAPALAAAKFPTPKVGPEHRHLLSCLYFGECCACGITHSELRERPFKDKDCLVKPKPEDSEEVRVLKSMCAKFLEEKKERYRIPSFNTYAWAPYSKSFCEISFTVCPECERNIKQTMKEYVDDHMSKYPSELERV
jgi:hypothetical protein